MGRRPATQPLTPTDSPEANGAEPNGADQPSSAPSRRLPRGINRVELLGRLAADPELHYTPGGLPVCNLRVATNDTSWSEFHDVVAWRQQAEFAANYLGKGRLVFVVGRLQHRSWDAEDGTKRYRTEVNAFDVQALDFKPQDSGDDTDAAPAVGDLADAFA